MTTHPNIPIGKLVTSVEAWDPHSAPADAFINYIDINAVDRETKQIENVSRIRASDAPSRARQLVREDDVLVSTVRPNLNAVAKVSASFDGATASTGFTVLRPDRSRLDPAYLYYWVRSPQFVRHMVNRATGASYPAVSDAIVKESLIPLPSLPEQRRIAAILDKADQIRRQRQQAQQRLKNLIPAIFHEMFGDSESNPNGYSVQPLGELCDVVGGGTPSKVHPEFWQGDIPWVSPKDMSAFEIEDTEDHITNTALEKSATNTVPVESILMVTRSGILKHTVPIAITRRTMAINQDIKAFITKQNINSLFLAHQLRNISHKILSMVRVGATVQNLETNALRKLPLVVPPINNQMRFVQQVNRIHALEAAYATSQHQLDSLFQSLLHRAFRGEL